MVKNMFERLKQYRIDFAYSKYQYYAACNRANRELDNCLLWRKRKEIAIAFLTGLSFVGAVKNTPTLNIFVGIFSIISLILSLVLYLEKDYYPEPEKFQYVGDQYNMLYKKAKDLEAQYSDGMLTTKKLSEEITKLHNRQEELLAIAPKTKDEDYLTGKKNIDKGQQDYTMSDYKKT